MASTAKRKGRANRAAISKDQWKHWYRTVLAARRLDDEAVKYIRKGMGWGYHAAFAGHDGIQLQIGLAFRPNVDFMFGY